MTEPGYEIDRREGLTAQERAVLALLSEESSYGAVGRRLDPPVSRQRVSQIVARLVEKGAARRTEHGWFERTAEPVTPEP